MPPAHLVGWESVSLPGPPFPLLSPRLSRILGRVRGECGTALALQGFILCCVTALRQAEKNAFSWLIITQLAVGLTVQGRIRAQKTKFRNSQGTKRIVWSQKQHRPFHAPDPASLQVITGRPAMHLQINTETHTAVSSLPSRAAYHSTPETPGGSTQRQL